MNNKSSYETQQEELRLTQEFTRRTNAIVSLKEKLKSAKLDSAINAMDYLRLAVATIGGEKDLEFVEVYRNHIKAHTRLPGNSSVFPFLKATDPRNQIVSYVLPSIMLACPYVKGIKVIPTQGRSSFIILETGDVPHESSSDS